MSKNLAFCVHGHFYQPPREDPLTGEIPVEPGAAPFNNWNERINDHCYRPNAQLGNFERISFNIGPTLMEWLAEHDPLTLKSIIEQDQANLKRYGIGNAIAQSYNHTILPLASDQDKLTQVKWGIADFEFRFGRRPQGMWLPETAVNTETLLTLVECGIEFTILAPWQADTHALDTTHPYWVLLPNNQKISVFFYNQDLSTRVSFDPGATANADRFILESIMPQYRLVKGKAVEPQLIMIASDGELYGHHQPFRDKFLSYLLDSGLDSFPVEQTFPALWLQQHPPEQSVSILEDTSWSCHHGVMRWKGSCGCTNNSEWKEPLRDALEAIARSVDELYTRTIQGYGGDPWRLRNAFIQVVLGSETLEELVTRQIDHPLDEEEVKQIGYLLWAQYERQRMFTSCGWFFDDFDRIEPRNNVAYAAQAVWLVEAATGINLTPLAVKGLSKVSSQRTGLRADMLFRKQMNRANHSW